MEKPVMNVVIVGGSIAGLMAGISLKNKGHRVRILEQSTSSTRESHAAGIRMGPQAQLFMSKYDGGEHKYTVDCAGLKFVDLASKVVRFTKNPMKMTSWELLYYRLRANFDKISRDHSAESILNVAQETVTYENGKRVTNIINETKCLRVEVDDLVNNNKESIKADLVIAADGSSSRIRQIVSNATTGKSAASYAGYVAWRGLVRESEVSAETLKAINGAFLVLKTPPNYILAYTIPDENGSLIPGERMINFVWYYQCPQNSAEFEDIMTDSDRHLHRATLPPGKMQERVWTRQKKYANSVLSSPFVELIEKTQQPFISTVKEAMASQSAFFEGRLLFIGDALASFRPHIAMSVNQAALNCLLLERLFEGELSLGEWMRQVEQYARETQLLSTLAGNFAMHGVSGKTIASCGLYLWAAFLNRIWSLRSALLF